MSKKETTEFKAGDKVKIERPKKKKDPKRIGSQETPQFFAAVFNGNEGAIKYDQVYQVSGRDKTILVDNEARPLPLIDKEFVNHSRFNGLFSAVKSPNKTDKTEDKE